MSQTRGSLQGERFVGIGAGDMDRITAQLVALAKQLGPKNEAILQANAVAARYFARGMRRAVKDSHPKYVRVRSANRKPLNVKRGTLRRSVMAWRVDERYNTFWAGPRVGRKVPPTRDGWFANIVEGDDQFIEGTNRNKDVFTDTIRQLQPTTQRWLVKKYQREVERVAAQISKMP